ncbi:OmpA family protein [Devosia sediminis]|uniref:OmpA family protein n=1 Tax=Devosia sediminis TaxID=2798801 RepID=A0A934IW18_9HYPH|nr:OmpA family protein [Devosia sediminis]MBJ3785392.1 OmpA family protein [Devosia sediminis]
MIRDLLKWVAPGLVTVLGGTVAALAMATPTMLDTLAAEGRASLAAAGADWAHISVDGRRIHLDGTTPSDDEKQLALAGLDAIAGVAGVEETVTIAPLAAPFRINVSIEDGAVTVFGSVANEAQRQELTALDGVATADLQIRSGQPASAPWRAAVDFALAQAPLVENGYFELSGLTLNAVGRAGSEKALGQLQIALAQLPSGIARGEIRLEPVRVAPYTWRAEFDGERIAISGHVPEERIVERLRMADVSGIPVATGLSLASGAPEGFAEQTRLLVEQLARLEQGEARIVDGVSELTGVPPSIEIAQAVTEAVSGPNSIVTLSSPRVADYWLSISRQAGGTLVFDGFVPDEATREQFAAIDGADVSFLKFGAGAPDAYHRAADYGLNLLDHLSEGRILLSGSTLSVSGMARSSTDFRTVLDRLASDVPQGVLLAENAVEAPRAASYTFTIRRDSAGSVTLEGLLPNPDIEARLLAEAGPAARSTVSYASGEAAGFVAAAEQALNFLPWLRSGVVSFDGDGWTVEGEPRSAIDKGSIESEYAIRGLARSGWTLALSQPAESPGFADPYLWSAERLADGSFLFAGNVPAASVQSWLKVHVGTRVADTSRIAHGAPGGFADNVRIAVETLLSLEQGRVVYDGTSWSLVGAAADGIQKETALSLAAALGASQDADISVPDLAPAAPYIWSATKSADGVTLAGTVPAESLQRFLAVRAGPAVDDQTELRADAPEGFSSDVLQALDVLALLAEGEVAFDGEKWSATGLALAPDAFASATTLLGTASPRWSLKLKDPVVEATAPPVAQPAEPPLAATPTASGYPFRAIRADDGTVTLGGQVPAPATAQYLATLTGGDAGALSVVPDAPEGFALAAQTGARTLMRLQPGELVLSDGNWRLSGEAASEADRAAIEAEVATLGSAWSAAITAPSGLAQCQARLAELSAHNAILFQSGAAIIAAGAAAELDAFAQALLLCPDAVIEVEGHTDSDGDDQLNLALSVARAEAVVNALVERNVSPSRLYAIGYGETQPVADNATAEGKRANRRIVVSVRAPEDQD